MKPTKLLTAIICCISFALLSCSDDNDSQSKLNPPAWTLGTWKDEAGVYTAKFTSNNLIFGNDVTSLDFVKMANSTNAISLTELTNTDTDYKVKFAGITYHFRKKSSSQIAYILADDPEYPAEWIMNKIN